MNFLEEKRDFLKEKLNRITFLKDGLDVIHAAMSIQAYEVPVISFTDRTGTLQEKSALKKKLIQLKELHQLGKTLKELAVPVPKELTKYKELLDIRSTCTKLQRLSKLEITEKSFESKLEKYKELKEYRSALKELKAEMRNKKEELAALISMLDLREEKLKEFKVCPLCHQPLN
jgi:DNA repair exonuclease SbcCD ATPase subunit